MDRQSFLGSAVVITSKAKYKLGLAPFVHVSVPAIYGRGWNPDFVLIKKYESEADIVITFPHTIPEEHKSYFLRLAKEVSKEKRVFVYEVSLELGGGVDPDMIERAKFVYEQFQPIIHIAAGIALDMVKNYIYDVLKGIYKDRTNPVLQSQFTLQRTAGVTRFNYIFDNLDAETAIHAGRLIPNLKKAHQSKTLPEDGVYVDVYLRFLEKKNTWVSIKV